MKSIILLCILLSSIWGAKIDSFAKETSYLRDYSSGLKAAELQDKLIMLVLVADYCPWCKKFERKTLSNKSVSKLVKEHFIPVIVDSYRDKSSYPKKFYTSTLPTVYFINPKTQNILNVSTLYVKKNEFIKSIKKALKLFKEEKK